MNLNDLITLLKALNDSPRLSALHDEVEKLVLKQIKAMLGGD